MFTNDSAFNYWILQTLAMAVTALLIPKLRITSIFGAVGAVVAISTVNSTLWDANLFSAIPNTLTKQAFLLFIANGAIFWIMAKLLPGIEVDGFMPALFAPVIFTVCSMLANTYGADIDWGVVAGKTFDTVGNVRDQFSNQFPEQDRPAKPKVKSKTKEAAAKAKLRAPQMEMPELEVRVPLGKIAGSALKEALRPPTRKAADE